MGFESLNESHNCYSSTLLFWLLISLLSCSLANILPPNSNDRRPSCPNQKVWLSTAAGKQCKKSHAGKDSIKADFSGTWEKISSYGMKKYLNAHGFSDDQAQAIAKEPYVQTWDPVDERRDIWKVITWKANGQHRELVYPLGDWIESYYKGDSILFDKEDKATKHLSSIQRATHWEKDKLRGWIHVTKSMTPLGFEETKRYIEDGRMHVERMFSENGCGQSMIIAKQIFSKKS